MPTDYKELLKFHELLMSNAPRDYTPWYFPVASNEKDPDGIAIASRAGKISSCCSAEWVKKEKQKNCAKCGKSIGSWKAAYAKLSIDEAVERLKLGGNVGISSRDGELLVIYDRDSPIVKDKISTLTVTSRKRIAGHSYCWRKEGDNSLNVNIPTELGEVRSCDQYVLAPGSFVPVSDKEKTIEDDKYGLYTVKDAIAPTIITLEELPDVFLQQIETSKKERKRIDDLPKKVFTKTDGKKSALFELTIQDIVGFYDSSERVTHPLHDSETESNFSVSGDLAHCWRHLVSLNAIQFLCVKANYMTCNEAGTGHWDSPHPSAIIGDEGAIFFAWKQAVIDSLIPANDKIPAKALNYLHKNKNLLDTLPQKQKNEIENEEKDDSYTKILELLLKKEKAEATEILVRKIKATETIFTVRDDEFSEMWIYKDGIYIPQARTFIKEFCRGKLGAAYTSHLVNTVIAKIEAETYVDSKQFFNQKNIEEIATQNGVLNIFTKELSDFTPEKIFFNKIPITFNPTSDCPTIKKHLGTILNDSDDINVMQELFGYFLLKDYRFEQAVMFLGNGRNGKGKTVELIKNFLGGENCASIPLQQFETDPYSVSELMNKLANLCGDLDKTAIVKSGRFKELTGRDQISAQRKFLPRTQFINHAKLVFACNDLPQTSDTSIAFWSRWILLDFPYKFVTQEEFDATPIKEQEKLKVRDADIISKLITAEELTGLLNFALVGLERLMKQGKFSKSSTSEQIEHTWLRKSSSFLAFCQDCVEEDWEAEISKEEFRKAYYQYCKLHKLRSINDWEIKKQLTVNYSVGEKRDNVEGKYTHFWSGVKLKGIAIEIADKMHNLGDFGE